MRKVVRITLAVVVMLVVLAVVRNYRLNHGTTVPVTPITQKSSNAPVNTPVTKADQVAKPASSSSASIFPSVASGDYTFSLVTKDGLTRSYRVRIPKGYDPSNASSVLFAFHGGFGSAEQFETASHLSDFADKRGFIVVYGQGTSLGVVRAPVWNAGGCCGKAAGKIDDVGYVRDVVAEVQKKYHVDASRIYMTGMSNGGMMVNRLACEAADLFAGAAIVSGTIQINSCHPVKQMPILIMHGTKDTNVPYYGGVGGKSFNQSTYISVEQELAEWGKRNGCEGTASVTTVPPLVNDGKTVDRLDFPRCVQATVLYRVNNGIHEWPSGEASSNILEKPLPTKVINASKTILDFFGLQ